MAKLLSDNLTYVSFPINKFYEDEDGNLVVKGTVTDGSVDSDRQIVDPDFSAKALNEWMASGPNVRVMHSPSLYPAGRGLKVDLGQGSHELESLVVEDTAKKLVKNRVLRAYSVGISDPVIKRDPTGRAPGGIIVGGTLAEVSLVDRPANKNCQLVLAKSADLDVPWTYGDLEALLANAEHAAVTKGKKGKKPKDTADTADNEADYLDNDDDPGDDSSDGDEDDGDDTDPSDNPDIEKSYDAARAAWLSREPSMDGAPISGTTFLAKRAQWERWQAEGETAGLDGTPDGQARWLAKRDVDTEAGGGVAPDAASPDKDDEAVPDLTKGAKDCPKCGASIHADSKLRRCPSCGRKLPKADTTKGSKVANRNSRPLPPDVKPAGKHREPDGQQVELFEHDAGLPTDHDDTTDHVPASVKGKKGKKGKPFPGAAAPFGSDERARGGSGGSDGPDDDYADDGPDDDADDAPAQKSAAPYTVKRMHDATCAAYHWDTVADTYPSLKGVADAIVPSFFLDQVEAAAHKGDMASVAALAGVAQAADELHKGHVEPAKMADARAMLHKSFTDLYPDTRLTPGAPPRPGQFQRPYLSAGRAALNATGGRPTNVPPPANTPDPDDFQRPYLTDGRQTEPPANKGSNNLDTGGSVASGASRTYYGNATRQATELAMRAMHDHITQTFPDMCPMAASKAVMPPDMRDANRPRPVDVPPSAKAPGEKTTAAGLTKKQVTRLVKAAVKDATATITHRYETKLAALSEQLDEFGAKPDPAQAPLRGAVVRKAATAGDTSPQPAVKVSLVEKARSSVEAQNAEYVEYLQRMTHSDDPAKREQAEGILTQLLTTNP